MNNGYNNFKHCNNKELVEISKIIENVKDERDKKILELYFLEGQSSRTISKGKQFESRSARNKGEFISARTVNNIVKEYLGKYIEKRNSNQVTKKKAQKQRSYRETTKLKREFNYQMCCKCGIFTDVDIHHMIPVAFGGTTDNQNLMPLCESCHSEYTQWFRKNRKEMLINMINYNYDDISELIQEVRK